MVLAEVEIEKWWLDQEQKKVRKDKNTVLGTGKPHSQNTIAVLFSYIDAR